VGEFLSGRKIDKIPEGLISYFKQRVQDYPKEVATGWKNMGLSLIGRGDERTPIGSINSPVAESVGGLSMTSPQAVEAVGRGLQKLLRQSDKTTKGIQNTNETMRVLKLIPDYGLDFVDDISSVRKLKRISSGAVDPIGRARTLPSGKTEIVRTQRLPARGMLHEIGHSYDTRMAKSVKNTKRSQYAKLLEEMTNISRGATNRYNIKKKAWGEKGIRYSDYKYVNAREILARNFSNKMTVALKGRKTPLTKTEFKNVYKNSLYDTVNLIKKEAPNLLKKGKEAMTKKYAFTSKTVKIKNKTESEKLEEIMSTWGAN